MENRGWVKIHYKILDNPVCMKDAEHFAVWMYLLLHATHKPIKMDFAGTIIELQPGQLITSRNSICKTLKVNRSKVERVLRLQISEHQIEQQTSNKSRLITILNWGEYQKNEQQNEQQVSINKNIRIRKKEKVPLRKTNILTLTEVAEILTGQEIYLFLLERFGLAFESPTDIQAMIDWLEDHDADGKNLNGRKNPKSFARNWMKRKIEFAKAKGIDLTVKTEGQLTAREKAMRFHGITDAELKGEKDD